MDRAGCQSVVYHVVHSHSWGDSWSLFSQLWSPMWLWEAAGLTTKPLHQTHWWVLKAGAFHLLLWGKKYANFIYFFRQMHLDAILSSVSRLELDNNPECLTWTKHNINKAKKYTVLKCSVIPFQPFLPCTECQVRHKLISNLIFNNLPRTASEVINLNFMCYF